MIPRPVRKDADPLAVFQQIRLERLSKIELRSLIRGLEEANFTAELRAMALERELMVSRARESYLASWVRSLRKDGAT